MPRTRIKMRKMRRPRTSPTRFCAGRICFCSKGIKKGFSYSVGITQTTHTRPKKKRKISSHNKNTAPRERHDALLLVSSSSSEEFPAFVAVVAQRKRAVVHLLDFCLVLYNTFYGQNCVAFFFLFFETLNHPCVFFQPLFLDLVLIKNDSTLLLC